MRQSLSLLHLPEKKKNFKKSRQNPRPLFSEEGACAAYGIEVFVVVFSNPLTGDQQHRSKKYIFLYLKKKEKIDVMTD